MRLFLDAPNLGDLEKKKLLECVDSNYVSTVGPFVNEFEERFSRFLDAKSAVSVQSGTAAIHMALVELGIGPGDEVILPALTFVASANPVLYVGANPVFVDVDPLSWTLDPKKTEQAITKKTKAIIPVHLYGNPCDMDSLVKLANENDLAIIEDATESLGAKWKRQYTGTMGDFGCFSFNGNKLITTGGGGMVVAKDITKAKHIKFLVNQAREASKGYFHEELGYNYRMTNLEAALGLAQMERLEKFLQQKKAFMKIYRDILSDLPFIRFQEELPYGESSWWLPSMIIDAEGIAIADFQLQLNEAGIPTRRLFGPLVDYPYLRKYLKHDEYSIARNLYQKGINLPASTLNSKEDTAKAAEIIRSFLTNRLMKGQSK
jgi:perosamine synthetase